MAERPSPVQMPGWLMDADDLSRLDPVSRLAAFSDMRAALHNEANLFRDMRVTPEQNGGHELRERLAGAKDALARWAIFEGEYAFRTVDLARVRNVGDWDGTDEVEGELRLLVDRLTQQGRCEGFVPRDSSEAGIRITIDPPLLCEEGLVAVRRKRLLVSTAPQPCTFVDVRAAARGEDGTRVAMVRDEIDKVAEFALRVDDLRALDRHAAAEVLQIIESGVPDEITNHGRRLRSPRVIEDAIERRDGMLIPATTTYYAEHKLSDIRPAA